MSYIIDRFEGRFAVCEDENGNFINIEKNIISMEAKEGDVLIFINDMYEVDVTATSKRKKDIKRLASELWID